jgi:hypothetical protein
MKYYIGLKNSSPDGEEVFALRPFLFFFVFLAKILPLMVWS